MLPSREALSYYYSYVLIQELIEASIRFAELKDSRIKVIMKLTLNQYCPNYDSFHVWHEQNPRVMMFVLHKNSICAYFQSKIRDVQKPWFDLSCPRFYYETLWHWEVKDWQLQVQETDRKIQRFHWALCKFIGRGQLMSAFQSLFNTMDMLSFLAGQTCGKV